MGMENTNHYLTTICGGQSSAAVLLRRSGKRKGYGDEENLQPGATGSKSSNCCSSLAVRLAARSDTLVRGPIWARYLWYISLLKFSFILWSTTDTMHRKVA